MFMFMGSKNFHCYMYNSMACSVITCCGDAMWWHEMSLSLYVILSYIGCGYVWNHLSLRNHFSQGYYWEIDCFVDTHSYVCMEKQLHTQTHTYRQTHRHTYTQKHIRTHTDTYTHTYRQTHRHTHTNTRCGVTLMLAYIKQAIQSNVPFVYIISLHKRKK